VTRDAHLRLHVRSTRGPEVGHTIEQPIGCRTTQTCRRRCHFPYYASEMKNVRAELAAVADDESDFADRMHSKERIVTAARSRRRRAFEGTLTTSLLPIAWMKEIGRLRHGRRTERPANYCEDEAVVCDCNSSTAASSRRTRARSSTTSSWRSRALSAASN
jgi:hypothetical protein